MAECVAQDKRLNGMKAAMRTIALLTLYLGLAAGLAAAEEPSQDPLDNWPQWRGPLAIGFAPKGDPPLCWDATTHVKWKAALQGKGSSSPIVWGDRVFVLTAVDTGREAVAADIPKPDPAFQTRTQPPTTYYQFIVLCLDRSSGKLRWRQVAIEQVPHEGHHPTHSYAAASPITDGRFLYASFGSRGIYCYDLDGKLQWKRDLGRLHTRLGWGEGASPVVHGDTLVVSWDQEKDSFIIALNARTGKTKWKVSRDEPTSWATPLVVEYQGKAQVIVPATNKIRSYDLATGELIWQCGGLTVNVIPSPVVAGNVVYCMSGYRGAAALALPLGAKGDITGSEQILWKYEKGTPYVPSPVLVDHRLYFTKSNTPFLTCLDTRTGKPLITEARLPGLTSLYASPVAAKDRIYLTGQDGTVVVIKNSDKLEVLATNRLDDPIDASPAIAGKQILLRSKENLYCIE
jgi:outer membrane protein assembly factor BamB